MPTSTARTPPAAGPVVQAAKLQYGPEIPAVRAALAPDTAAVLNSGESSGGQAAESLPPPSQDVAGDIEVSDFGRRLRIPATLPGAQAPQIRLPPSTEADFRNRVIDQLFPDLPKLRPLQLPRATAERPAMTLGQLQDLALEYNPTLIQARANVRSLFGDAIQAGTHPNPTVGYESDTVGSSANRDYQGIYFSQLIKTANKLGLARAVANIDVMNAQQLVRRTRLEVLSQVKAGYFSVLVAEENVIVSDALVRFMEEVFRIQRSRLKQVAAPFETAQLRGLADMAKSQLVLAQNSYAAAWKTLAARMGLPEMPPTAVRGRADMPVPVVNYQAALARMLSVHPDIIIGGNMVHRAQYALQLEQVKPIPDIWLYGTFQKDFTTPGARSTSYNTQLGLPLPIWDRNRGNIVSAQGDLAQARQQLRRAQVELTQQLANTFAQYETNRFQFQMYSDHILGDFARAYRGVYERHQSEPDEVGFEGIIVAQQNLASAVIAYIAALNGQWAAVADLANLMQIENLDDVGRIGGGPPLPAPEPIPPPEPQPRRAPANPQGGRR